jgi:hypothetical protein
VLLDVTLSLKLEALEFHTELVAPVQSRIKFWAVGKDTVMTLVVTFTTGSKRPLGAWPATVIDEKLSPLTVAVFIDEEVLLIIV